jgi:hypothetical protein
MKQRQTTLTLLGILAVFLTACETIEVGTVGKNTPTPNLAQATVTAPEAQPTHTATQEAQSPPSETPTAMPTSTPHPTPTDTLTPTSTPVPPGGALHELVLTTTISNLSGFWWSPSMMVDESNPSAVSYRAVQMIMAGADEYAEIVRYPGEADAQAAFGAPHTTFHTMPAQHGRVTGTESGHYQDARWITWLSGPCIYRAQTSYNSTIEGETRDPLPVAEALYQAGVEHGLIPLE